MAFFCVDGNTFAPNKFGGILGGRHAVVLEFHHTLFIAVHLSIGRLFAKNTDFYR